MLYRRCNECPTITPDAAGDNDLCRAHAQLAEQRARADAAELALAELLVQVGRLVSYMQDAPELWGNPSADTVVAGLERLEAAAIIDGPDTSRGAALLAAANAMADEILNAGMKACPDVLAMEAKARAWRALGRGGC